MSVMHLKPAATQFFTNGVSASRRDGKRQANHYSRAVLSRIVRLT